MKTVIITGAAGGLGGVVIQKFLASGYQVIATVSNEVDIGKMQPHPHLDVRVMDLTNADETNIFAEAVIHQYVEIHGLLTLVGGFVMGGVEETTLPDISKMIAVNFETAFNVSKPIFKHFKEKGYGRLVFIGARPAIEPADGKSMIAYSLSKSLLFKLAELLNADVKNKNIVASVVVPSILDTPANRAAMPEANSNLWVSPEKLSEVVEFIFSPQGDQIREPVIKVYNNV